MNIECFSSLTTTCDFTACYAVAAAEAQTDRNKIARAIPLNSYDIHNAAPFAFLVSHDALVQRRATSRGHLYLNN